MRIVGRDILEAFGRRHAAARPFLSAWVSLIEHGRYRHFGEVKRLFPSADYVKPRTVFNVGGNKFRLIATVDYGLQVVLVNAMLTHAEYDRERWKK